jgi:8-oxo-dGTP pyrophosphatase MutT (NUDIX family)
MLSDLLTGRQAAVFDPPTKPAKETKEYYRLLRPYIGHAPILLPGAAAFIRDGQGRVLLQRRQDNGLWGLPGGAQDLAETATQTMIREVCEETGLEVEPVRRVGVYSDPSFGRTLHNGDQVQPIVACYEARIAGGAMHTDSPETLDLAFFAADDLPEMIRCCRIKAGDGFADQPTAFFR